jgi:hypothetical protein
LLRVARSSYGLLGIVYEATFRVRPVAPMRVETITYRLEAFGDKLDQFNEIRRKYDPKDRLLNKYFAGFFPPSPKRSFDSQLLTSLQGRPRS